MGRLKGKTFKGGPGACYPGKLKVTSCILNDVLTKKLLRQTTVFSLSQYLIIQFNKQILRFNNYKYNIYYKMYAIGILRDGPQIDNPRQRKVLKS